MREPFRVAHCSPWQRPRQDDGPIGRCHAARRKLPSNTILDGSRSSPATLAPTAPFTIRSARRVSIAGHPARPAAPIRATWPFTRRLAMRSVPAFGLAGDAGPTMRHVMGVMRQGLPTSAATSKRRPMCPILPPSRDALVSALITSTGFSGPSLALRRAATHSHSGPPACETHCEQEIAP